MPIQKEEKWMPTANVAKERQNQRWKTCFRPRLQPPPNSRRWNHDGKEDVQHSKTENQITEICHLSNKKSQKNRSACIIKKYLRWVSSKHRFFRMISNWLNQSWSLFETGPSGSWISAVSCCVFVSCCFVELVATRDILVYNTTNSLEQKITHRTKQLLTFTPLTTVCWQCFKRKILIPTSESLLKWGGLHLFDPQKNHEKDGDGSLQIIKRTPKIEWEKT